MSDEDQIEFEQGQRRYLSTDIARCNGTDAQVCVKCRRREPGAEYRQIYVVPDVRIDGFCENAIHPLDWSA